MLSLNDSVTKIKGISAAYASKLEKLGIQSIKDLITYFPRDYNDSSEISTIKDAVLDLDIEKKYSFKIKVLDFKSNYIRGSRSLQRGSFYDDSGNIEVMFFNQPFLKNVFRPGFEYYVQGKIKQKGKRITLYPTNYEQVLDSRESVHLSRISPEYALTAGVPKKWFRNRIKQVLDTLKSNEIELNNNISGIINDDELISSVYSAHFPESILELNESVKQLSHIELIELHLKILRSNENKVKYSPPEITNKAKIKDLTSDFLKLLPFKPTQDQQKIINNLSEKISNGALLNELIQGDVGSGKTLIMMYLSFLISKFFYQVVILAPTTILAKQHYENFKKIFKNQKLSIDLAIGEKKDTEPADIIIGTSAVLARHENLIKKLGIIMIDEQHRFGVRQREDLLKPYEQQIAQQKFMPHFINLTATPIPRTIAEAIFSDLSVNTINTKPAGRKPIKSFLVSEDKRGDALNWIQEQIVKEHIQIYWLVPLVEESEKLDLESVKSLYTKLKENLQGVKLELLHGKLKPKEKTEVMSKFASGKIDILVTTSVIEVGVDVANATVMIVENAERFGLAQLHQIRGRVGRGEKQSYFFMFHSKEITDDAKNRLEFISKHNDGLKVAEFDLQRRGPGEVYGTRQSGIPNLKIAKLNDLEAIKNSKVDALKLYKEGVKNVFLFL